MAGPEIQIDSLSTLSVGTIDLSTFALNKVYEMPIELPAGIHLLDNISSITVSFDSSKLETKTMNLPSSCVQVVNLPSTYQLTVETERLMNVTSAAPRVAGNADPGQVVIEIDAEDFSWPLASRTLPAACMCPPTAKSLRWAAMCCSATESNWPKFKPPGTHAKVYNKKKES